MLVTKFLWPWRHENCGKFVPRVWILSPVVSLIHFRVCLKEQKTNIDLCDNLYDLQM